MDLTLESGKLTVTQKKVTKHDKEDVDSSKYEISSANEIGHPTPE